MATRRYHGRGLIVTSDESGPLTRLMTAHGTVGAELEGTALSVGWDSVVIVRPDGSLIVANASLGEPIEVDKPGGGAWVSVGRPVVPATSPPVRTGTNQHLVQLADEADKGPLSVGSLIVVDAAGIATPIYEFSQGSHLASWSRDNDWVVVVEDSSITLVSIADGSKVPLGALVPDSHWVLTAG